LPSHPRVNAGSPARGSGWWSGY